MRRILIGTVVAAVWVSVVFASVQPSRRTPGAGGTANARSALVGTWKLVTISPASSSGDPIGLMMYDTDGYVGVAIMQGGRQKYAGAEPTPTEAKAALATFTSYFGTYAVDPAAKSVAFQFDGSLDPNLTRTSQESSFKIAGNRLTLNLPLRAKGVEHALRWERLPNLNTLTPSQRRLIFENACHEGNYALTNILAGARAEQAAATAK